MNKHVLAATSVWGMCLLAFLPSYADAAKTIAKNAPGDGSLTAVEQDVCPERDYYPVSNEVMARCWPNGVVPYFVNNETSLDDNDVAQDFSTLGRWRGLTQGGVRFVNVDSTDYTEQPHIKLTVYNGGPRTKGLRGIREADGTLLTGMREIWIRPNKLRSTNHELGHTLGLWHQQRHPDSSKCVTLSSTASDRLGKEFFIGPYSSDSVMHYLNCIGKNPNCGFTWFSSDADQCPNSAPEPTDFDAHQIKKMYGVNGDYLHDTSFCAGVSEEIHMGDFNGDGLDDLLCLVKAGGQDPGARMVDFATNDPENIYGGEIWEKRSNRFCRSLNRQLFVGDFNGDGREDLLCHDLTDGRRFVDHANSVGTFNGTDTRPEGRFCWGSDRQIYIGDFDGDGKADQLCHNETSGTRSIDYGATGLDGKDVMATNAFCRESNRYIVVGDFNGDGRDDLLCQDLDTGERWIDFANKLGELRGTNWRSISDSRARRFCWGGTRRLHGADVNGDSRTDLICHNRKLGSVSVDFAGADPAREGSGLLGKDWYGEISLCNAQDSQLLIGHLPRHPQSDSLFCHNRVTGHQAARYPRYGCGSSSATIWTY